MKRTIIRLLDSFGIGGATDADQLTGTAADGTQFSDMGANTLGHIAEQCAKGLANDGRSGPLNVMQEGDLLVITADHGCDPTWPGTNHTREHIPAIFYGHSVKPGSVGLRDTFADIGQSIADVHHLPALEYGKSIFS
jgi:phosphopentomutase